MVAIRHIASKQGVAAAGFKGFPLGKGKEVITNRPAIQEQFDRIQVQCFRIGEGEGYRNAGIDGLAQLFLKGVHAGSVA